MVIFVVWTKALDKAESIIYQLPQWFHPGLQQNRFAGLSVGEAMLQSRALRQGFRYFRQEFLRQEPFVKVRVVLSSQVLFSFADRVPLRPVFLRTSTSTTDKKRAEFPSL